MKRAFLAVIFLALISAFLIGCPTEAKETPVPETPSTPETPSIPETPTPPVPETPNYSKEFWGEWLRMDTGETWYINSQAIKVGNVTKTVSLTKQSARVVEVTDGGRKYYLYASRVANAHFTGRIVSLEQGSLSARALGGIGGIEVTISNLNDQANEITTTTDAGGNFTAEDIIPGEEYEITPEGGTPTIVTPEGDGDDVGVITIVNGVNFKTTIDSSGIYYADSTAASFTITVTNTGNEDCLAATLQLDFGNGLSSSSSVSSVLGTIEPGRTKKIPVSVSCGPMQEESEYKKIGVTITDTINHKTWDDSVSIKFYKMPVTYYIEASPVTAGKPSDVAGVVITPSAQAYPFSGKSASVTLPWSMDNMVVFSGATADTEVFYSLGINSVPSKNFSGFTDTGNYEPNDTEEAVAIITQHQIMSYLHKNDIDYYRINFTDGFPPVVTAGDGQLMVSWMAIEGATTYEVWIGTADNSASAAKYGDDVMGLSTTISGLTNGTTYYVWVRAKTSGGTSGFSPSASGTLTVSAGLYDNVLDGAHRIGSQNLAAAFTYLSVNAVTGHNYFIVLGADETGSTLSYSGKTIGITLIGIGAERTINLSEDTALFTVGTGVTLTLGDKITLVGRSSNTSSLVSVSGTLVMNDGAKIIGNTASHGGGVYVSGGTFTMSGGTISGNTASSSGGGVSVNDGTFTMSGGTISGNTASPYGGGVSVNDGTFTMSGGTISGNTASSSSSSSSRGGGVYVSGGTFMMSGGTISGNTASSSGGGVYVIGRTFTMSGGTISGNTASSSGGGVSINSSGGTFMMSGGTISGNTVSSSRESYGGGVYVYGNGTFTMSGGIISGNTSSSTFYSPSYPPASYGGGVSVDGGTFTMSGGTISGNTASSSGGESRGGGVYVGSYGGIFRKTPGVGGNNSGIIYGSEASRNDADGVPLKNTAGNGAAVYRFSLSKMRNTTADQTDYIDTSTLTGQGLSSSGSAPFGQ